MTRTVVWIVAGILLVCQSPAWGQGSPSRPREVAMRGAFSSAATQPVAPLIAPPGPRGYHGIALQVCNRQRMEDFKGAIREIAATGADTVLLSLAACQDNAASSSVAVNPDRTPDRQEVTELTRLARSQGLRVILVPIVLLNNPRGNEWRGRIVPDDPAPWWADYRRYIETYARAAADGGADVLMIGSELNRMESSAEQWRDLIKSLRRDFAGLKLGYSANWDRYWKVPFWDELDFAGVTTYYTLAEHEEPTVGEIVGAWQPHKDLLLDWHKRVGKPVIFTEAGWYSRKGSAMFPWNYYHNEGQTSLTEQANLYEAFLKVWSDEAALSAVAGVIFWEWTLDPGGPDDESYTPKGKPAEKIMRDYFKTHARPGGQPPVVGAK